MEKFTVTATSNGGILSSSSFPSKPQSRDTSFTSYLHTKPTTPTTIDDTEISIFDAEKYFNENNNTPNPNVSPSSVSVSSSVTIDGVGGAYGGTRTSYRTGSFHATPTVSSEASWNSQSGLLSHQPGSISVTMKNVNRLDHHHQHQHHRHDNETLMTAKNKKESSIKWFFRRKCPCTGKKSVQVDEKTSSSEPNTKIPVLATHFSPGSRTGEIEQPKEFADNDVIVKPSAAEAAGGRYSGRFSSENKFSDETGRRVIPLVRPSFNDAATTGGFSFPILSPPVVTPVKPPATQLDDPPRESLEVFRPVERKSTELQLGNLRSFTFPTSPKARMLTQLDDDAGSDASSDLFEIESFSTQSTMYPMYRLRDSLDEISNGDARRVLHYRQSLDEIRTPSIAPTECYEPSEVSIDWSVTTAEGYGFGLGFGFDRGSVTNVSIAESEYEPKNKKVDIDNNHNNKRRGNGGLLSCRCEKAVNIGPHPIKLLPEQQRSNPAFPVEVGRIQATLRAPGQRRREYLRFLAENDATIEDEDIGICVRKSYRYLLDYDVELPVSILHADGLNTRARENEIDRHFWCEVFREMIIETEAQRATVKEIVLDEIDVEDEMIVGGELIRCGVVGHLNKVAAVGVEEKLFVHSFIVKEEAFTVSDSFSDDEDQGVPDPAEWEHVEGNQCCENLNRKWAQARNERRITPSDVLKYYSVKYATSSGGAYFSSSSTRPQFYDLNYAERV
ncbi:hypothetical protein GIB67_037808 [Kingdonia uniflora]|uniref:Uncharacterized protein n=1 Tax=Kingdonia uniflora TaxID=39325 RepID=A0A7J7LVC5_9MAGN|nr:hypothetical protein GIB67_037808 [Kingdonia uniflora]